MTNMNEKNPNPFTTLGVIAGILSKSLGVLGATAGATVEALRDGSIDGRDLAGIAGAVVGGLFAVGAAAFFAPAAATAATVTAAATGLGIATSALGKALGHFLHDASTKGGLSEEGGVTGKDFRNEALDQLEDPLDGGEIGFDLSFLRRGSSERQVEQDGSRSSSELLRRGDPLDNTGRGEGRGESFGGADKGSSESQSPGSGSSGGGGPSVGSQSPSQPSGSQGSGNQSSGQAPGPDQNPGSKTAPGRPSSPPDPDSTPSVGGSKGKAGTDGQDGAGLYSPILLDLDGDGVEVTELSKSIIFMDAGGDGLLHRTAWVGHGDGVLFIDDDGDGAISEKKEYVVTEWDPTATDDLAALRAVFGSNDDGVLDASDARFADFKVLVTNPDSSTTAKTLTELRQP